MARPELRIATTSASRSPEREALAAAIVRCDGARKQLADAHAASERASELVYEADRRHSEAEAALAAAGDANAEHARKVAMGAAVGASSIMRDARARVQDAEDELVAARAARDRLREAVPEESDLGWAKSALDKALGSVVAHSASVAAFLEETRDMVDQVEGRINVLRLLQRLDLPDGPMKQAMMSLQSRPPSTPDPEKHPAAAPWLAALEALKRDADAALPGKGNE